MKLTPLPRGGVVDVVFGAGRYYRIPSEDFATDGRMVEMVTSRDGSAHTTHTLLLKDIDTVAITLHPSMLAGAEAPFVTIGEGVTDRRPCRCPFCRRATDQRAAEGG